MSRAQSGLAIPDGEGLVAVTKCLVFTEVSVKSRNYSANSGWLCTIKAVVDGEGRGRRETGGEAEAKGWSSYAAQLRCFLRRFGYKKWSRRIECKLVDLNQFIKSLLPNLVEKKRREKRTVTGWPFTASRHKSVKHICQHHPDGSTT